jgi:GDP-D-mannose 3', 5'-epimerase
MVVMGKSAIVCGAGGFIGHHLVKRLKSEGYSVRGIDIKYPEFEKSSADEFLLKDLRSVSPSDWILKDVEEIYQLAADMGGIGYIMEPENDARIMHNSTSINLNVLESARLGTGGVKPKVFFSSSACVYTERNDSYIHACAEQDAYPAELDNGYAWEKLYAERLYAAYAHTYGLPVRIGRIHNCYGPLGTWRGGREKAPAALCRKIAEAANHGTIEVWGDGQQLRSFMYVEDCVDGIRRMMEHSGFLPPLNIGSEEMVRIDKLVELICKIAGKTVACRHVIAPDKPVGVSARNSDNRMIWDFLRWKPDTLLEIGLVPTYHWVRSQVLGFALNHRLDTVTP